MNAAIALLLAVLFATAPATGATLRPFGTLAGPTVAVSDLWDDAGAAAATVLGPGPGPGERIVVEAVQLAAIARQFGVAWHPDSAAARSILERPGQLLPVERVIAALRTWLAGAGAPAGQIELAGFTPPLVAPDAAASVGVEQCGWEAESGRFSASLAVTGRAMATIRLRVTGRVLATAPALVATRRLRSGTALVAADVAVAQLPLERLRGPAATAPAQAEGKLLRRAVGDGEPVLLADLLPAPVIAKGGRVTVTIDGLGVALTATAEALQPGALGERIAVRNPASRAVLLALVTGPGTVRVEPGSLPLRSPPPGAAP